MQLNVGMLTATLFFLTGCGGASGPDLIDVSGTVKYNGEPVKYGVIKFVPAQGSDAPRRTAEIREGQYNASDRSALGVGTYRIEILAYDAEPAGANFVPVSDPTSEKAASKAAEQILPEKYNTKSEIEPFTVTAGSGPITKNYDLK